MRIILLIALLVLAPAQTGVGILEVTVRDAFTGEAIPSVQTTVSSLLTFTPTTVMTDERGRAVFRNLTFGNYTLRAERAGYIRFGASTQCESYAVVSVETPEPRCEFLLNRVSTLSGRVTNENRNPVVGSRVVALLVSYRSGERTLVNAAGSGVVAQDETDDRGEYRLTGLPRGEYYLRVDSSNVLSDSNSPDNLARLSYFPGVLDSTVATPVSVRGDDISGIDIRVPFGRVFKISGTIVNPLSEGITPAGQSGQGGVFYLAPDRPESLEEPTLLVSRGAPSDDPTVTKFEIAGITPGAYFLYAIGGGISTGRIVNRLQVTVQDKDITNLRIVLKPGTEVIGRFRINGIAPTLNWQAMGVGARAKERLPLPSTLGNLGKVANPNTQEFVLSQLIEDMRYSLTVEGLPKGLYVSDIRQGGLSVLNEGIRANGTAGEVEIVLETQAGVVRGLVRDPSGQPAAQAGVVLVPVGPRRGNPLFHRRALANTNTKSEFEIWSVAPGEYKLFAWRTVFPGGQADENGQFMAPYESKGTAVTITPGATINIDLTVLPTQ